MIIIYLIVIIVTFGYFHALYRLHNEDIIWEYWHDRDYEIKRLWKERGFLKTPFRETDGDK